MPDLRFDGKVVVVTGAGGGLGRAYALEYAKHGAKVVVNDLGGGQRGGDSGSHAAADNVVNEIKQLGGTAVANYDSVEHGAKIIQTAIDNYGRIDILVNNAGILRDVSFAKMKDEDFQLMINIHLNGTYSVTKAAWAHMLKQKFGRIIMVTSAAGLYGNHGQSHYSAVKMGILGFASALYQEGKKHNINVNTIAPIAGSRMTATVMPPDLVKALAPEYVAPLVLYLTHDSTTETGGVYEVGAGWVSKVRWQRTNGHSFNIKQKFTPEQVQSQWSKITDFSTDAQYPRSPQDAFASIMANLNNTGDDEPAQAAPSKSQGKSDKVDVATALKHRFEPHTFSYTERDTILYALGIGAGSDLIADSSDLRYVYENADNFQTFPTFGVVIPSQALAGLISTPGLKFNPMMLLHGEQYMELKKPLPTSASLTSHARISNIYDKTSGALVLLDVVTKDEQGNEVLFNQFNVFIRGLGGFGGDKGPKQPDYSPPLKAPDVVHRERTLENQAVLYRLSGDYNPLHIDPAMAKMGNFERPILHGLCTFGYATRAVLKHYANNDAARFKSIRVRFVKSVYPGETLITEMWRSDENPNQILFRTKVAERGEYVLANAMIELHPDPATAKTQSGTASTGSALPENTGFEAEAVFKQLASAASAEQVKKIQAIYRFDLHKGDKKQSWLVDLKNGTGSVSGATADSKADVVLALSDSNFVKLLSGKLDAQKAFMSGDIKFKGNIMLAQKLQLLKPSSKL